MEVLMGISEHLAHGIYEGLYVGENSELRTYRCWRHAKRFRFVLRCCSWHHCKKAFDNCAAIEDGAQEVVI